MYVRVSTKRQRGKTYRYVQLVESYRREDGMPTNRVVANLGALPERSVENLKIALRAGRRGKAVVIPDDSPGVADRMQIQANLRYLDIAVMLELWRSWRMDELLQELIPAAEAAAPADEVIAALVLQRCIAPGSKRYAQRWFPTTALPELLDLSPARFNNTRLHRVLEQLHSATPALQERLPSMYSGRGVSSSALFIDMTDTYFEGRGCGLAQRHRTKAGHRNKWAIGLVLLVNELGFPLRWKVVSSKTPEHRAMCDVVRDISGLPWLGDLPLICDRAMGRSATVHELLDTGVHFVTAAPVSCIESHTSELPYSAFSSLKLDATSDSRERDDAAVLEVARSLGWQEVDESLFVCDLGIVDFESNVETRQIRRRGGSAARSKGRGGNAAARQLRKAMALRHRLDAGGYQSLKELARDEGISRTRVSQFLGLLRLAPDIQDAILAAPPDVQLSEYLLRPLVKEKNPGQQREMFKRLVAVEQGPARKRRPHAARRAGPDQLRLVAYFNPQMFMEQRRRATEHLAEIALFVDDLNKELAAARRSREEAATRRKLMRKLEKYNYSSAFDVSLEPLELKSKSGSTINSFRCRLELKPKEWERRQRYNGFVLLLCHPGVLHPATRLTLYYRGKDAIEKRIQTIKSVVKLRPVYHYTDTKVQAHVTLCMLALILDATLKHRLQGAGVALSAAACLEILETCHLNRMQQAPDGQSIYSLTRTTIAQREVLDAIGLSLLADDDYIAGIVGPNS